MSGVYIAGFKKPDACAHYIDKYTVVHRCKMTRQNGSCKLQPAYVDGKRMNIKEQYERCPLQPVPDHGPLIDAEQLNQVSLFFTDKGQLKEIKAPVVIPADREGD